MPFFHHTKASGKCLKVAQECFMPYYQKRIQSDFHTKTQNKKEQSLEGM